MRKIISILLIIILISTLILPGISMAADLVSITFPDVNMYNEMVEELGDKIASKNDETKTIEMTQENIDSVTRLYLSGVNDLEITSIEGIEKFTNLTYLDLHVNNIENISV